MALFDRIAHVSEAVKLKRPRKVMSPLARSYDAPARKEERPTKPEPEPASSSSEVGRQPTPELGRKGVPPSLPPRREPAAAPPKKISRTPAETATQWPPKGKIEHEPLSDEELKSHVHSLAGAPHGSREHWNSAIALTRHYVPRIKRTVHQFTKKHEGRPATKDEIESAFNTLNLGHIPSYAHGPKGFMAGQDYSTVSSLPTPKINPLKRAAENLVGSGRKAHSKLFGTYVESALRGALRNIKYADRRTSRRRDWALRGSPEAFRELHARQRQKRGTAPETSGPEAAAIGKEEREGEGADIIRWHLRRVMKGMKHPRSAKAKIYPKVIEDYIKHQLAGNWRNPQGPQVAGRGELGTSKNVWTTGRLAKHYGISDPTMSKLLSKFHSAVREDPHLGKLAFEWLEGNIPLLEATMTKPKTLAVITRVEKMHPCWGKHGNPPKWKAIRGVIRKSVGTRKGVTGAFALKLLRGVHHAHLPQSIDTLDRLRLNMQRRKQQERSPKYRELLAMSNLSPSTLSVISEITEAATTFRRGRAAAPGEEPRIAVRPKTPVNIPPARQAEVAKKVKVTAKKPAAPSAQQPEKLAGLLPGAVKTPVAQPQQARAPQPRAPQAQPDKTAGLRRLPPPLPQRPAAQAPVAQPQQARAPQAQPQASKFELVPQGGTREPPRRGQYSRESPSLWSRVKKAGRVGLEFAKGVSDYDPDNPQYRTKIRQQTISTPQGKRQMINVTRQRPLSHRIISGLEKAVGAAKEPLPRPRAQRPAPPTLPPERPVPKGRLIRQTPEGGETRTGKILGRIPPRQKVAGLLGGQVAKTVTTDPDQERRKQSQKRRSPGGPAINPIVAEKMKKGLKQRGRPPLTPSAMARQTSDIEIPLGNIVSEWIKRESIAVL